MSTVIGWFLNKEPQAIYFIDQILSMYNNGQLTDVQVRDYLLAYLPTIVRNSVKWKIRQWKPEHLRSLLLSTNLSADQCQSILYALADGLLIDVLVDLMTYGASDTVVSSTTTITGVNRYRTLSVFAGVTLNANGRPGVIIANKLVNLGTIKSTDGGAYGTDGYGGGNGGKGGGGLLILAKELYNYGIIQENGANGAGGGTVPTGGNYSGGAGENGAFVIVLGAPGLGGNGGYQAGAGNFNGGGGGGTYGLAGGAGGGSTSTVYTASDLLKAIIDWWLVNVLGKTPTTTKSIPSFYGSGGGAGSARDTYGASGGGGGGGGEIIIFTARLHNSGAIYANGGAGGNGGGEGNYDAGGGGGGGGIINVIYITATAIGTLAAVGGAGGVGDYSGTDGLDGSALLMPVV